MKSKLSKEQAKCILGEAPWDKKFWACDGRAYSTLYDLEDALKTMDDGIFNYHCNEQKNDFANWVEYVIGDQKLTGKMRKAKTKSTMLKSVSAHLKELEKCCSDSEQKLNKKVKVSNK